MCRRHPTLKAGWSLVEFSWFCCLLPKECKPPLRPSRRDRRRAPQASRPGIFCPVLPSPSSRTDPNDLTECVCERCLVIKSRLNRDVDQRHAGLAHQMLGPLDAMLNQPPVRGDTERGLERAGKVADRKSTLPCDVRKPHPAMQVLVK